MTALTKAQQSKVEQVLSARYQKLIEEVRDELENTGEKQYMDIIGQVPPDIGDQSVADALADLNAQIIDRQIHEIRDIEDARKRLKDKRYGACIECGDEIAFERLMVYPTAKRCFRCQQQYEKTYARENTPSL